MLFGTFSALIAIALCAAAYALVFGVSRIFVKGWAAFFMAASMLFFGFTAATIYSVLIRPFWMGPENGASVLLYLAAPWLVGFAAMAVSGGFFVRWQRRVQGALALKTFE